MSFRAGRVDKVYVVEKRKLSIEEDFNDLGDVDNIRRLIKDRNLTVLIRLPLTIKNLNRCFLWIQTWVIVPQCLFLTRRSVLKIVKDLTQFIREHMLDDGGSKEKLVALQERLMI